MDSRPPHHAWDDLVPGTDPADAHPVVATPGTAGARGTEASASFQVLSLEQYAASHARSLHQPHDR